MPSPLVEPWEMEESLILFALFLKIPVFTGISKKKL
jgi:hypothetical protein